MRTDEFTYDPLRDPAIGGSVEYLRHQASLSHQNGREASLSDKCAEHLAALVEDRNRLRLVLLEIADAHGDLAEQAPYWARQALCQHTEVKPHDRSGIPQCTYCWSTDVPTETGGSDRG